MSIVPINKINKVINKRPSGAPVAHRVERVPYRLIPERSDPGLNPAHGQFLHVLPLYLPHPPLYLTL